jgi:hypothetical protein
MQQSASVEITDCYKNMNTTTWTKQHRDTVFTAFEGGVAVPFFHAGK